MSGACLVFLVLDTFREMLPNKVVLSTQLLWIWNGMDFMDPVIAVVLCDRAVSVPRAGVLCAAEVGRD